MGTISFIPNQKDLATFQSRFQAYLSPSKNPHIQAFYRLDGATASLYKSGKFLLQGTKAEEYAGLLGQEVTASSQIDQTSLSIMGSDEVGNGSYFGGLAVVSALVRPQDIDWLKSLGVGDSKQINDRTIRRLAPLLKEKLPHQALLLGPAKYNQVIASGYNAVSVKVALHNQAHFLLQERGYQADRILIDAFTSEQNYKRYLKNESNHFPQEVILEEKAEGKYLAVAAASILARDLFLTNLEELSLQIGYDLPSGAGSPSDKVAAQILKTYGMEGLNQVAKLHFKNTEKAKKLM